MMPEEKTLHAEISSYISTLLRTNFGKGPTSVYVSVKRPYITVHFRGFMAPMEAILMKQNESKRILETRSLMMNDLRQEIKMQFLKIADLDIKDIYADWDLEKKTGMIIAILDEEPSEAFEWPADIDQKEFEEKVDLASLKAEKIPEKTESFWLNDRTILVKRTGILVRIEKELIRNGFVEELKVTKRPLERQVMQEVQIESVLKRDVSEIFIDWNFDEDISYIALMLEPKSS